MPNVWVAAGTGGAPVPVRVFVSCACAVRA